LQKSRSIACAPEPSPGQASLYPCSDGGLLLVRVAQKLKENGEDKAAFGIAR
jgi:hypothetical protein